MILVNSCAHDAKLDRKMINRHDSGKRKMMAVSNPMMGSVGTSTETKKMIAKRSEKVNNSAASSSIVCNLIHQVFNHSLQVKLD